jgi:hypothetical protein
LPRHFCRERPYFAAIKTETAQRAIIELPKCVIDSPRLPTLLVARALGV